MRIVPRLKTVVPRGKTVCTNHVPFRQHTQDWVASTKPKRLKVLITGSAGFIGSHIADFCAVNMHMDVVGVDDLSGGFESNTDIFRHNRGVLVVGDLRDRQFVKKLFEEYGPFDVVYHIAAYAAEGLSHFIRTFNYENNLLASMNIINACILHPPLVLVFTSSIAAYGTSDGQLPLYEDSPQLPEDPYGIAKHSVELDLKAAHHMFGLNYIIFRPHNVYGPRQNIADKFRNAVGIFMNQILRKEPLTIFGDGEQTRGFSYISDVAEVIAGSPAFPEAYNNDFFVGSDDHYSVNRLAHMVADSMNKTQYPLQYLDARKEVQHAYASHGKLECVFNPNHPIQLNEGLKRTALFVMEHGAFEPTGYMQIEVRKNLPPSWESWLAAPKQETETIHPKCLSHAIIQEKYTQSAHVPSDINEHLAVLLQYAQEYEHVTEIGVRFVNSAWAFALAGVRRTMQGKNYTYKAMDITRQPSVSELEDILAQCPQIAFSYMEADDLVVKPWFTNLLFIDTWHTKRPLSAELTRWATFVHDVIILHDTELFAHIDEHLGARPALVESQYEPSDGLTQGLWLAVEEFLNKHPEWTMHEQRKNNNGLTVLKRVSKPSSIIKKMAAPPSKIVTDVVMFVPTPIEWEQKRLAVHRQFTREGWRDSQVILIFVLGTRTGVQLEHSLDTSSVTHLPGASYIYTACRDMGDEFNNANGTSSTTCKVYEAYKHIAQKYDARFVWRGADDTYVNLQLFIHTMMPSLQPSRLFMGRLRTPTCCTTDQDLLLESQPNIQALFGLHQFGHYMSGMGYVVSWDVVVFIASLTIPPRQTWCEDIMVGMWLNPFEIDWIDVASTTDYFMAENANVNSNNRLALAVHYVKDGDWARIQDDGRFI